MTDTDHLLSREQVAARLAVSARSVRRYTESGRLPSVHVGRNVRYRRSDVERLIAEEAATGGQDCPQAGHDGPCPVEPASAVATNGQREPDAVNTGQEGPQAASSGHGVPELTRDVPEEPSVANQGPGVASPPAEVTAQAVEALREHLAAVRAENAALREEVARQAAEVARKAEAAGLWQGRALTLETQLKQLTPPATTAVMRPTGPLVQRVGDVEDDSHPTSPTLWQRLKGLFG